MLVQSQLCTLVRWRTILQSFRFVIDDSRSVHVAVSGQEGQANIRLLQGSDVVTTIAAHEHMTALLLHLPDDQGLALRSHACEDTDLVHCQPEIRLSLHRSIEGIACHDQCKLLRQLCGRCGERPLLASGVAGGNDPLDLPRTRESEKQARQRASHDAASPCDVQGRQRRVASQHCDTVPGLAQGSEDHARVRARLALEGDEAREKQFTFHVLPHEVHDVGAQLCLGELPEGQREDAEARLRQRGVGLVEPRRSRVLGQELADGLGRALD
mmetsp:Transcript_47956/g.154723  ORF Transcript_47956/g.154723 Transcript_47956/m.154723 type:complete len:270 (+) Transcript_47956:1560-2369(+)